ncbi:MAG: hypothetical protein LC777_18770 [Actinobacteria bacterium]|nr:hypothetical protein [Actinomycetota bacterium]
MSELEVLKVREEVLQAMYWMRAEGLAEEPSARELSSFLAVPADTLATYLDRFVAEGHLEPTANGFQLTDTGTEAGKRSFADEFADMTGSTHGDCGADCTFCNSDPNAAASCLEQNQSGEHVHQH